MKGHRALRRTYDEMPPDPEEAGDEPRYKWVVGREANYQEQAIDYLRSKYLIELAHRYHVPIPRGEEHWMQPRGADEEYLTLEAAHKLRGEIREEQKAVWEYWHSRVTFALALIGSIFGVLAYFRK
jgi:hypothetical protein